MSEMNRKDFLKGMVGAAAGSAAGGHPGAEMVPALEKTGEISGESA